MKRHLVHIYGAGAAVLLLVGVIADGWQHSAAVRILGLLGLIAWLGEYRLHNVRREMQDVTRHLQDVAGQLQAVMRPNAAAYELGVHDGFREGWESRGERPRPVVVPLHGERDERRRADSPMRSLAVAGDAQRN